MGKKKNGLFRYADWVDKLLILMGSLGSIGDGITTPLTMIVLSGMINNYSASDSNSFSNHVVDRVISCFYIWCCNSFFNCNLLVVMYYVSVSLQYALNLLYIAIGVGLCAFFGKISRTIHLCSLFAITTIFTINTGLITYQIVNERSKYDYSSRKFSIMMFKTLIYR